MNKQKLLLEIGCEELPARQQNIVSQQLLKQLTQELSNANINYSEAKHYATPRRIAVIITAVSTSQSDTIIEHLGPYYNQAYNQQGTPTQACLGFAKSHGIKVDQLAVKKTPRGKRIAHQAKQKGELTSHLLPEIVEKTFKKISLTRTMRWKENLGSFIRPVRWLVLLLGQELIPTTLFGVESSQNTLGHRFLCPQKLKVSSPDDYEKLLYSEGQVIADFKLRQEKIKKSITKVIKAPNQAIIHLDLLDEITGLVEWPVVLSATFNSEYLSLPDEVLMTVIQTQLKCFPVKKENQLLPQFVIISNTKSTDSSHIIKGNEQLINARLADANFFYQKDLKNPLESHCQSLKKIIFQQSLGSLLDKVKRLIKLSSIIADQTNANSEIIKRAAWLSKSDLPSHMVTEFPKLQGVMGYYYALNSQESRACALAIREHYYPRFAQDQLPQSPEGIALALADKIDTLIGVFGTSQASEHNDKDPFALRRLAIGILRILIEKQLDINLKQLIEQTKKGYLHNRLTNQQTVEQSLNFIMNRLKAWYQEQGISSDLFKCVLLRQPNTLLDFDCRIKAMKTFQTLPEANTLIMINKRINNILKKADEHASQLIDTALFEKKEETDLFKLLKKYQKITEKLYQKRNYTKIFTELSGLEKTIHHFFDKTIIIHKDIRIRRNRLSLLARLQTLLSKVADFSQLHT